jgi:hypothetical protein
VQTTIGTSLKPTGVGTDLNGNLYISDSNSNSVLKVAAAGGTPTTLITGLSNPGQIAVDGYGSVFVADTGNNRIAVMPAGGGTPVSLGVGLSAPQGVAVDANENIYVADTGNARIVRINVGTNGNSSQVQLPIYTLTTPVALALDTAGNLYIADKSGTGAVYEWYTQQSTSGGLLTLNFGTTTFVPTGVAVDAAGDVYVSDATNLQIAVYPMTSGSLSINYNQEIAGLVAPVGVAVDGNGSIYAADSGQTGVIALNRTQSAISFPVTNLNTTSTEQWSFTNVGNAALNFNGTQFATITGAKAAIFSLTSAPSGGCVLGTAIPSGTACLVNANYTPTTTSYPGFDTVTAAPITNAANNSSLSATLTGQAVLLINTTTALSVTTPTTSTIYYGQSVTVTAATTFASTSGTASGTIYFTVDGHKQTGIPFSNTTTPTAVLQLPKNYLTVGTHSISVSVIFTGYVYASSGNNLTLTIVKATTSTALTPTPTITTSSTPNGTTFTVNVTSPYATGETGTVTIYSGTTLLTTTPIAVVNGVATYSSPIPNPNASPAVLSFPSSSFSAVYSGDSNFTASTSPTVTPSGNFSIGPQTQTVYLVQGDNTFINFQLQPYFNYSGTITPTCTGLPSYALCGFVPVNQTITNTSPVLFTLTIYTNTNLNAQARTQPGLTRWALLLPFSLAGLLALRRRTLRGRVAPALLLMALMLVGAMAVNGCTNPIVPPTTGVSTPAGTQTVSVNFADANTPPVSHAVTFTLNVCNANPTAANANTCQLY